MSESAFGEPFKKIIGTQDIEPRTDRSDDITGILIQESVLHAPKYGERTFRNIVYELQDAVEKYKMNLMLDEGGNSYRVAFTGDEDTKTDDMTPSLHIRDKTAFMAGLARLQKMIGPGHGNGAWAYGQKMIDIWFNATPDDFEHPQRFLQQQIYALEHPAFKNFETDEWNNLGTLKEIDLPFLVKNAGTHPDTESAYELQFRVGEGEVDDLPSVRYAVINPDTAIVYAVQMPFIDGDSERSAQDKLKKRIGDPYKMERKMEKFEDRKRNLTRFNGFLGRRIESSDKEERGRVPDDLAGTSPNALISMTAALELFREQGIKNIKIPTYLPWRQHMDNVEFDDPEGDIDKRILEQTVRLVRRLAFEVKGIEVVSFGEGDHYLQVTIGDILESDRPILANVLSLTKTVQAEDE